MKSLTAVAGLLTMALLFSNCTSNKAPLKYPETKKVEQSDNYFGTIVNDPYRWLEADTAVDTKDWVLRQQAFTEAYLSNIPFRGQIRDRYKSLLNFDKYFGAIHAGEYIIFSKMEGLKNQPIYYVQKGLEGTPTVLIDPNALSEDGSISIGLDGVSNDRKYIAYHINKGGSDWQTMKVMEIASGKTLPDELNWLKFSSVAWYQDGFFYSRYDQPVEGMELSGKNEFHKVYYHKLGDAQEKDQLVYEDKTVSQMYYFPQVTEDESFLFIYKSPGTDGMEVIFKNLKNNQKDFKLLFKGFEYNYGVLNNVGDKLIVNTNDGAGNYRVVEVDSKNPTKKSWREIIPERPEKLESSMTAGGKLFASYLKDACTKIYQFDLDGSHEMEVQLPAIGSASGIGSFKDDAFAFYDFSSFNYPPCIFKYDIATGKSEVFKKSVPNADLESLETEQVFFTSKDGTKVPMFLVHKKGIKLDGSHPTLLYAYGGFSASSTPFYSTSKVILFENDGIFAMANIRGGGEYGEAWHKGGNLLNKQNCFDDFIAAAEYLVEKKYTSKEKLAINGGSNGGLLVGAVMTQRPELFKVAIPEVGVMDMLRFQKFTVGWGWTVEYGSSDSAKYFPTLYKYSPLHNIKDSVNYPATLVLTADHDDRVVPAHSFKFIATLQEKQKGPNPVLIRIETNQGHGASGAALSKVIEEETNKWSFMFFNMGIEPNYK